MCDMAIYTMQIYKVVHLTGFNLTFKSFCSDMEFFSHCDKSGMTPYKG